MVNEVKMGVRDAILGLFGQGWSRRRIARELGVNRRTVGRHIALAKKESKCTTNPTPGSDRPVEAEFEGQAPARPELPGPPSKCEPFRETISEKLDAGLTARARLAGPQDRARLRRELPVGEAILPPPRQEDRAAVPEDRGRARRGSPGRRGRRGSALRG